MSVSHSHLFKHKTPRRRTGTMETSFCKI